MIACKHFRVGSTARRWLGVIRTGIDYTLNHPLIPVDLLVDGMLPSNIMFNYKQLSVLRRDNTQYIVREPLEVNWIELEAIR